MIIWSFNLLTQLQSILLFKILYNFAYILINTITNTIFCQ